MKITCEIELEWLEEDGTIDKSVKADIVNQLAARMNDETFKEIKIAASQKLNDLISAKINEVMENFLGRPVTLTDRYGDTKATFENVTEMLKDRFDKFMDEKVDQNGRVSDSCSYNKYTRMEYFLGKIAKEHAERSIAAWTKEAEAKAKAMIDKTVKDKISEVILKNITLPSTP